MKKLLYLSLTLCGIFWLLAFNACKGCGDPKEPTSDGGMIAFDMEPTVADTADKVIRSPGGKLIRIIGVDYDREAAAASTSLGDVVEVASVKSDTLCNIVLDAPAIARSVFFENEEYVGNVPNIPTLKDAYGKASWPMMIANSCVVKDLKSTCLWNVILKGSDCITAVDLPQYVGSTMREFMALPDSTKKRFVRVRGECDCAMPGGKCGCIVPYGDPRALPNANAFVPHGWAGRRDLNYVKQVDGGFESRVSP